MYIVWAFEPINLEIWVYTLLKYIQMQYIFLLNYQSEDIKVDYYTKETEVKQFRNQSQV